MKRTIHSTAIVSPKAELDEGVVIGPYSIIEDEVCIGKNTVIGAYVRVFNFVEIGEDCKIYENSVLGREPQDHAFRGEETKVIIGDRTIIRENGDHKSRHKRGSGDGYRSRHISNGRRTHRT